MSARENVVLELKIKVFNPNGSTAIIDEVNTLQHITDKYDNRINIGEIENYQVYFRLHGSYQKIAEGILDYGM